jgi:hypothetical protein
MASGKTDQMAPVKRTIDTAANVALWPYRRFKRKLRRTNRASIRWAVRRRCQIAYLAIALMPLSLAVALTAWIAISISLRANPFSSLNALLTVILNWGYVSLALLYARIRYSKARRNWLRRHASQ